uniref:NADH-ubiquinone oxidoreductase chain 6 n=1 Tax=Lepidurus arcticus TaxID=77708 RepID=A0A5B7XU32_9CRUS|nr:NADH dehydrogenase subunit 6 [Lepidurus arcticus]QCZ36046.1 NADH dehydrogenase subunit 6 [Lepidurus arcticus]
MLMYSILSTFLLLNSFLFMTLTHPLSMGMSLMIQSILICLLSGTLFLNYWFSYTLFLIFLGGLLVLFIYISSLASNEMFNISPWMWIGGAAISMTLPCIYLYLENPSSNLMSHDWVCLINYKMFLVKIYNPLLFQMSLFLISYLLLCLLVVVNITKFDSSPLRLQK